MAALHGLLDLWKNQFLLLLTPRNQCDSLAIWKPNVGRRLCRADCNITRGVTVESRVGSGIEGPDLWEDLPVIEISCRPNLNSAERGTSLRRVHNLISRQEQRQASS